MKFINVLYLAIKMMVKKDVVLEGYHVDGPKIELD